MSDVRSNKYSSGWYAGDHVWPYIAGAVQAVKGVHDPSKSVLNAYNQQGPEGLAAVAFSPAETGSCWRSLVQKLSDGTPHTLLCPPGRSTPESLPELSV